MGGPRGATAPNPYPSPVGGEGNVGHPWNWTNGVLEGAGDGGRGEVGVGGRSRIEGPAGDGLPGARTGDPTRTGGRTSNMAADGVGASVVVTAPDDIGTAKVGSSVVCAIRT